MKFLTLRAAKQDAEGALIVQRYATFEILTVGGQSGVDRVPGVVNGDGVPENPVTANIAGLADVGAPDSPTEGYDVLTTNPDGSTQRKTLIWFDERAARDVVVATGQEVAEDAQQVATDRVVAQSASAAAAEYAGAAQTYGQVYPTIDLGRAAVADGGYFKVQRLGADNLKRTALYRRDSSSTQTFIDSYVSGPEFDGYFGPLPAETGYLFGFFSGWKLVAAIKLDGTFVAFKFALPADSVTAETLADAVAERLLPAQLSGALDSLARESGWLLALGEEDGLGVGFQIDGTVVGRLVDKWMRYVRPASSVPLLPSNRVIVAGDSTQTGDWPNQVGAAIGQTITRIGYGGQSATETAGLVGAMSTTVTVSGSQIPASGPVSITAINISILYNYDALTRSTTGTLAGVPGTLTIGAASAPGQRDGAYTFTRAAAGSVVACPAGTPFIPDNQALVRDAILIVCTGTNSRADPVGNLAAWKAIDNMMRAYFKSAFFVAPRNQSNETTGSANHTAILKGERLGRQFFGPRWLDLRRYLIDDALSIAGLTPTSQDIADSANDVIPNTFRSDSLHTFTVAGQAAEASFILSSLRARSVV